MPHRTIRSLLALLLLWLAALPAPAAAQFAAAAAKPAAATDASSDVYGRTSPRGLATGLISALAAQDFERASQYFDLSGVQARKRATLGVDYARRLQAALDAGGSLMQPVQLSSDAGGRIDDQLPADQERIGSLPGPKSSGEVPLIATSREEDGHTIWLVSAASISALPTSTAAGEGSRLRALFPPILRDTDFAGAPLADWMILIAGGILFYLAARLICWAVLRAVCSVKGVDRTGMVWRILDAAPTPFSVWLAMLLFLATIRTLEVAFVARQFVGRVAGTIAFLAFAWFLWRLIDVAADLVASRMEHSQRFRARSIIIFVRRAFKLLLLMFAAIQALNILGIDVTTGIAALGLGGLAIALGAQKTVENIVGSVSVVVDEPVRIGDFCKVGDITGTVEDIGIRSTRLRTNDRTRITIPNSNFASQQIENFAARDRLLFAPKLRLAPGLDADGVQRALDAIRAGLEEADYLFPGVRASFIGFGESSIDIEIFGWIDRSDYNEAMALQEKLLLALMRKIEEAGASFAVPVRQVQLAGTKPLTTVPGEEDS